MNRLRSSIEQRVALADEMQRDVIVRLRHEPTLCAALFQADGRIRSRTPDVRRHGDRNEQSHGGFSFFVRVARHVRGMRSGFSECKNSAGAVRLSFACGGILSYFNVFLSICTEQAQELAFFAAHPAPRRAACIFYGRADYAVFAWLRRGKLWISYPQYPPCFPHANGFWDFRCGQLYGKPMDPKRITPPCVLHNGAMRGMGIRLRLQDREVLPARMDGRRLYTAFSRLCSSIKSLSATSAINSPFVGLSFLP